MSQYLNFFIRNKDDFIPIGSYSRNTVLYEVIDAPYEKIIKLDESRIKSHIDEINGIIKNLDEEASDCNDRINRIMQATGDINEKINASEDYYDTIKFLKSSKLEKEKAIMYLNFLLDIEEECRYDQKENYIYCGKECGYPTKEDIV